MILKDESFKVNAMFENTKIILGIYFGYSSLKAFRLMQSGERVKTYLVNLDTLVRPKWQKISYKVYENYQFSLPPKHILS